MNIFDSSLFVFILLGISVVGIFFSKGSATRSSHEALVGSNVSVLSIALSVCSSFLSAVSLLGFPAEVYFRGSTPLWFLAVYVVAFPIVAFVFLPVFYHLKLPSVYTYLEKRFCFTCRIMASCTFIVQTVFYLAVALYAPSLALAQTLNFPILLSIFLTSLISAIYLFLGGAKGGIYTSALQMALILISLFLICVLALFDTSLGDIWDKNINGLRLETTDLRFNPQIRHSVFVFLIGGSGNIFSLFAVNQLTLQRYIVMPSLRQAQKVVLLNIPMNGLMCLMYTFMGLVMYASYHGCHPKINAPDQILPYYVENKLNWLPGLEGMFMAAVYSAGISTLTASYNALTAVLLEDIIKPLWPKVTKEKSQLSSTLNLKLINILPFVFAVMATILALAVRSLNTMILQISFSIFGAAGGAVLAIFILGLFCPTITSPAAALVAQIGTLVASISVAYGSLYYSVVPVNLPVVSSCTNQTMHEVYKWQDGYGTVTASQQEGIWVQISKMSYQYYCVWAIITCLSIGHITQLIINVVFKVKPAEVPRQLLAFHKPIKPPNIIIESPELQSLNKNCNPEEE